MKHRLAFIACASLLAMLASAASGHAGEFRFGFSFGYSSHPGYGYYSPWWPPRAYVYRPYVPAYVYAGPVIRPYPYVVYAYVPYRYRTVVAIGPRYSHRTYGKAYSSYKPRRYVRYDR